MSTAPTYDELYAARRAARGIVKDDAASELARRSAREFVHAATGLLHAMRRDERLAAAEAARDAAEAARDAELADDGEDVQTCDHGLAAWLCEGPMHYPADRP